MEPDDALAQMTKIIQVPNLIVDPTQSANENLEVGLFLGVTKSLLPLPNPLIIDRNMALHI